VLPKEREREKERRCSVYYRRSPGRLDLSHPNYGLVQGKREPALTINVIKKESLKSSVKCGDGVCLPDHNRKMIPQERSLIAEGSGS